MPHRDILTETILRAGGAGVSGGEADVAKIAGDLPLLVLPLTARAVPAHVVHRVAVLAGLCAVACRANRREGMLTAVALTCGNELSPVV